MPGILQPQRSTAMERVMHIQDKVQEWMQGDESAFDAVFCHYYPRLKRYLARYIKSEAAAEDMAMEVLTKLWQKKDALLDCTTFENYLFTMARNRMINQVRVKINEWLSLDNITERALNSNHDPLLLKELENVYHESVAVLPAQRRTIFMMHRNDNLTYKEIAKQLGISPRTVENQLSAALKQLRMAMAQYLASIIL